MNKDFPPQKLYDLQLIHQMCRGNQDQIQKMVLVFTDEVTKTIDEIKIAFTENDYPKIKSLAHKVKPTLTYFGTTNLQKELVYIEELLMKDFEVSELESKINITSELTKKVVEELKNDFSNNN